MITLGSPIVGGPKYTAVAGYTPQVEHIEVEATHLGL